MLQRNKNRPAGVRAAFTLACALSACGGDPPAIAPADSAAPRPPFVSTCTVPAPSMEAIRPAGRGGDGTAILPGGRNVQPAGKLLDVGGFPLALRVLPGDRYAVVTDGAFADQWLRLVDLQAADPKRSVVSEYEYPYKQGKPSDPGLFYGLALTRDGKRLYVSNGGFDPVPDSQRLADHYHTIEVFDLVEQGGHPRLRRDDLGTIELSFDVGAFRPGVVAPRLPAGLALSADEKRLYVATQYDGALAIFDVERPPGGGYGPRYGVEIGYADLPGTHPYDVAVDEATQTAYVSLWDGEKVAADRWVDGVAVVDVADPQKPVAMPLPIVTGKASEGMTIDGRTLFVTNADADTYSEIDLGTRAVRRSTPLFAGPGLGASPGAIFVDRPKPGGPNAGRPARLYIANAGANVVDVIDLDTGETGRIPTAWYPTAVVALSDGTLVVASAKGLGGGPTKRDLAPADYTNGVLQVVPPADKAALAAHSAVASDALFRMDRIAPRPACPSDGAARFPMPPDRFDRGLERARGESPIEHVFFFVRENKTYDVELGDMKEGNGDSSLTLFGESVTPNTHALARTFVLLDNCYSQAEKSLQGHIWTTSGATNDYTEKGWLQTSAREYRSSTAFGGGGPFERLTHPGSGSVFTHFDRAGISYRNFGEIANNLGAKVKLDTRFPGLVFNQDVLDVVKAEYLIETLLGPGEPPPPALSYIGLPNDHTHGGTPGKQTPESMVADNDEALGRFVDALSRSPYWDRSLVLVTQDDIQDGGDHVEGHRTICLAVSPWIKRGYRSSVNYDLASIYRTIDVILGAPPISLYERTAAPMYELFSPSPDRTPYTFIPRKVPPKTNAASGPMAEESEAIDFSRPDAEDLSRILWKIMRGGEPPWIVPRKADFSRDGDDD